jgi:hypothetical protein
MAQPCLFLGVVVGGWGFLFLCSVFFFFTLLPFCLFSTSPDFVSSVGHLMGGGCGWGSPAAAATVPNATPVCTIHTLPVWLGWSVGWLVGLTGGLHGGYEESEERKLGLLVPPGFRRSCPTCLTPDPRSGLTPTVTLSLAACCKPRVFPLSHDTTPVCRHDR